MERYVIPHLGDLCCFWAGRQFRKTHARLELFIVLRQGIKANRESTIQVMYADGFVTWIFLRNCHVVKRSSRKVRMEQTASGDEALILP